MTALADRDELARGVAHFARRTHPLQGRRAAAVALCVVLDDDGPGLLVTRRATRMRSHPGQWALPGGSIDDGESAPVAARRELREELAVDLPPAAALGLLDDYPTRSGYVITPVVLWAGRLADPITPNPEEVASVHVARVGDLDVTPHLVTIPESDRPVIRLPMLGAWIHAPTAAVIHQFSELALHGRTTRVDGYEQPVFAWK